MNGSEGKIVCKSCGKEVPVGSAFCGYCGAPVEGAGARPGAQPPPPPPTGPAYAQQPPQPLAPPSEPPPKRHGVLKWVLIGIGIIVLVLIVVVALTSDGEQKTTAPEQKATAPEQKATAPEAKVGEPVKADDLTVTVHGWQPSGGDGFFTPEPGNQYIVVDVEIENNGTENISVSTMLQMGIKSAEGYKYTEAMYFPEPQYPGGDILPGQKARGNVAFEVPEQVGTMFFVYEPLSLRGGEVRIKLQ